MNGSSDPPKYNNDMSKELKIGIFAIGILVVSFFLINYLRGEDIFNREIELSSRYANVEGLVSSAPVYIKGYKAGKVSEVIYDAETEDFQVICSIRKEFRIPEDSKMTIYSVDIMGGKGIRIDFGTSAAYAEDGDLLMSNFEAGLIDGLAGSVEPLIAKLTTTLDSLSHTVAKVNAILSDANRSRINGILTHLENSMAAMETVSASVSGKSDELESLITNLTAFSNKFEGIAEKVDTAMSGVNSVVSTISEADIAGIITSFKSLLENVNDPDGTIGKLFVDNSMYDSVESLLNDIDSLITKIQENPKKYLRISVF